MTSFSSALCQFFTFWFYSKTEICFIWSLVQTLNAAPCHPAPVQCHYCSPHHRRLRLERLKHPGFLHNPSSSFLTKFINTLKKHYMKCYMNMTLHFWLRQGAQGVTISVCPSVCPSVCDKVLSLHFSGSNLQAINQQKVSRAL